MSTKYKVGDFLTQRFYRTNNKYFLQITKIDMGAYWFQDCCTKTQDNEWIDRVDNNSSTVYEIRPINNEEKLELL